MGQRGTGLAGERVLRTQCAAAAGSRRCGQSRSLRRVAAARSSRCRPRLFPRCGRGRERSVSRGAGASPATAHWAAVGHPTKVRSSPRASNSPPFRLILNYSCSDCLSCPLSGPVSCVCPVGASSRAHLVLPTSASTAAGSAGRPPGRSRSRQPRACFSPQVPACSDDRTRFFWLLFQLPSRGRRGAGGRGGAPRAPPPRRTVVRTCVRAAAPREEW